MEVSGVFRSWETLVISSVFIRSFFTLFSTAASRPLPMLLIYSAICLSSPQSRSRGILYCRFPLEISLSPFMICSLLQAFVITYSSIKRSARQLKKKNSCMLPSKGPQIIYLMKRKQRKAKVAFSLAAVFLE